MSGYELVLYGLYYLVADLDQYLVIKAHTALQWMFLPSSTPSSAGFKAILAES